VTTTQPLPTPHLRAHCAPPARPRTDAARRSTGTVRPAVAGRVINSPDRTRSAYWSGSSTSRENAMVFAGPDCSGELLFPATFVLADSREEAQALAAALGMRADAEPLGRLGSIGWEADRLYNCAP
jgi:hypothetical protein